MRRPKVSVWLFITSKPNSAKLIQLTRSEVRLQLRALFGNCAGDFYSVKLFRYPRCPTHFSLSLLSQASTPWSAAARRRFGPMLVITTFIN